MCCYVCFVVVEVVVVCNAMSFVCVGGDNAYSVIKHYGIQSQAQYKFSFLILILILALGGLGGGERLTSRKRGLSSHFLLYKFVQLSHSAFFSCL
jgi:hypothetical protein